MTDQPSDGLERWMLYRSKHEPYIYPFRSEQAAEAFRDEHPSLIDYKPLRNDNPAKKHEPYCARCNESWPCQHVRNERQADRIIAAAAHRCERCKHQVSGMVIRVPGGGELGEDVVYHGRKGACRNQGLRELARLGHTEELARLHNEADRNERARDSQRRMREKIAAGMTWQEAYEAVRNETLEQRRLDEANGDPPA